MIASEFSKITEQTLSNVVDSSGKSVPKSSVIESLKVINDLKGRFKQGYKQTVDGISLADPGGVRLAAQQDQVDKICEEFKDMVSAVLLEHAMDAYVAAVGGRNALIIQLNEVMSQTIEADSRAKSAGVALAAAALENGRNAAPGLCSMASQLSRALAQRRDELLLQFYYGSRAYRFWTLQAEDEFGEALAQLKLDDPLPLLPETFASVKQKMFVDRSSEIESRIGSYYSTFPPAEAATDARGVCVEISDETYPEVIKSLQTKGRAHFTLPVCRKATLKSSSGFAGFADVRISKVRAWVFGAKTKDDDLRVDLLHGGREAIVSPDDDLSIFHHPPVHVVFKHNTSIINDTESLFHGTGGAVDGVLLDQNGDAVRAPIGPFTRWDIILDKSWNDGLITGGIHRVMLEFHGFARSFSV